MVTTRGFLYIVTGSKFLEEAVESATRLREVHPEANVGVITDSKPDSNLFDDTLLIDDPYRSHKDKVVQVRRSPYDETIFLDSDTYVCSDILDIFSILDQFDFAAAHDSGRRRELYTNDDVLVNAPEAFPMVNSGVMAFCDNQAVDTLFELWAQIYDRHNEKQDGIVNQPALREALYRSNVSMTVLPPEYNCRTPFPPYIRGTVRVLHGRVAEPSKVCRVLNSVNEDIRRTFYVANMNGETRIRIQPEKWPQRADLLWMSIKERGIMTTVEKIIDWFRGQPFNNE